MELRKKVLGHREGPRGTRPINREEAMQVYGNMRAKDLERSGFDYQRVEDIESSFYAGLDKRRRLEMAEGGMVKEDRNAMANCSMKPVHREYPRAGYYSSPYIDDSREVEE